MNRFICVLIVISVLCSVVFINGVVDAADSSYILSSDTTWTTGSKQVLTNSMVVPRGVTLTIEPGVTVDVLYSSLRIEGTLIARGTNQNRILFTTTANKNLGLYPHGLPHPLYIAPSSQGSIFENVDIADPIDISATVSVTGCSLGMPIFGGGLSVISNSHLDEIHIVSGSSTVEGNTINRIIISDGTPSISNNTINGWFRIWGGAPTVTKNIINGRTDVSFTPPYGIGSPVFSDNVFFAPIGTATPFIEGLEESENRNASLTIVNNVLTASVNPIIGISDGIFVNVSYNKIVGSSNAKTAVDIQGDSGSSFSFNFTTGSISNVRIGKGVNACIVGNQISNCQTGINIHHSDLQVANNSVFNNTIGISVDPSYFDHAEDNRTIEIVGNTITNNSVGIEYIEHIASKSLTAPLHIMNLTASPQVLSTANIGDYQTPIYIKNNDFSANSQYNFKMTGNETRINVDATNNWWGTSDANTIGRSIYDSKNDPNLGTVVFTPFITVPQSDSGLELPSTGQITIPVVVAAFIVVLVILAVAIIIRKNGTKNPK